MLYIDIDIHHGDGVEEAFYTTDRVLTVSFHKFGEYFPGTGDVKDVGASLGKYYSINFPLKDGMDDASYQSIFKPVIARIMLLYQPGAIVLQVRACAIRLTWGVHPPLPASFSCLLSLPALSASSLCLLSLPALSASSLCLLSLPPLSASSLDARVHCLLPRLILSPSLGVQCGADSLAGDRLGCFNLSIHGHAECVRFVLAQKVPTLILGGGGYTIRNVARCWTFETAVVLGEDISNELPYNDYYEYYGPDYRLHIPPNTMDNLNLPEHLEKLKTKVFEHMKQWQPAPNVQMAQAPPDANMGDEGADDDADPDERVSSRAADQNQEHGAEFYTGRPGE